MPSDSLLIREITNLREKLRISNARLGMFEASHPGQACAASHQLKMAKDALASSEAEVKAANERHAKSDWAREENWKACLEEKRKREEAERALVSAQQIMCHKFCPRHPVRGLGQLHGAECAALKSLLPPAKKSQEKL